jgi:hypothetical protein
MTSDICKQYAPAENVPETGPVLDEAVNEFPAGTEHVPPLSVPIPMPICTVGNGTPPGIVSTADNNVRVTVPLCVVVNGLVSLCRTPLTGAGTVPMNVSVTKVCGVVGNVVELLSLLQPAAKSVSGMTRWKGRHLMRAHRNRRTAISHSARPAAVQQRCRQNHAYGVQQRRELATRLSVFCDKPVDPKEKPPVREPAVPDCVRCFSR